ncbi:hypothetical protein J6590_043557 [Homalodisca vitripennis]|nr:hypothetical protein J6590_043557 [Homalodisca vitripennis]
MEERYYSYKPAKDDGTPYEETSTIIFMLPTTKCGFFIMLGPMKLTKAELTLEENEVTASTSAKAGRTSDTLFPGKLAD